MYLYYLGLRCLFVPYITRWFRIPSMPPHGLFRDPEKHSSMPPMVGQYQGWTLGSLYPKGSKYKYGVYMVSVLGIVIMIWGIYFVFEYLDP